MTSNGNGGNMLYHFLYLKNRLYAADMLVRVILSLIGFVVALIVNSASYILFPQYAYGFYLFMSCASFALTLLFLAFVLPSNYSLGVNAGFATMFILIILLVVLGLWTKATNNSIMWFVVENFEVSIAIAGVSVVAICGLSFVLSNLFFRKNIYS